MKICITSEGKNLDSQVDARFGRCQYFILVDSDTMELEVITNEAGSGGAGIQAGQLMADKGVGAVLTGNVGPNAFRTLDAAGIKAVTGVSGTIKEAVEKYKKGGFPEALDGPSVDSHFGMNK